MVVQTGPLLPDIPWEGLAAGGQVEGPADGVQGGAGLHAAAIGAVVLGAVAGRTADDGELRVCLPAQAHEGVGLVVLEQDVVMGHVLLDEGVFQHQGLKLTAHDDGVEVVDLAHHGVGLPVVAPPGLEVLAHPVFQLLGLAHVDNRALLVVHQVHPRRQGQAVGLLQQLLLGHGSLLLFGWSGGGPPPDGSAQTEKDCFVAETVSSSVDMCVIRRIRRNEPARPAPQRPPSHRSRQRSG